MNEIAFRKLHEVSSSNPGSKLNLYFSGALVLVATGYGTTDPFTNQAQVVDLESNNECSALMEYPLYLTDAVGSVMDGSPLICSGYGRSKSSGSYEYQSACYKYQKDAQEWLLHGSLNTGRSYAASAKIGNDLWVTGGYNGDDLKSSEYVKPDGSVIDGPDLPEAMSGHCMVTLHNGSVAILGGYPWSQLGFEDYSTLDYLTRTVFNMN